MVHIHINRVQLVVRAGNIVVAPGDGCAHFLQHISKANIALYAVAANTGHLHGATFNRPGGEEVRSRRGVAFHQIVPRRNILLITVYDEALVILIFNFNTEGFHQVQGDINIRFGDQVALDANGGVLRRQRRSHQQRGQKLTGNAAVNLHAAAIETTFQA